jgi:hypothetical protein
MRRSLVEAIVENGEGPLRRDILIKHSFDAGVVKQASGWEYARTIYSGHWEERTANRSVGPMSRAWRAVDKLIKSGKETSGWLRVERNAENNLILRVRGLKQVAKGWRVPSLHIDATLEPELRQFFWPQLKCQSPIEVDSSPSVRLWQAIDESFSKRSTVPLQGEVNSSEAIKENRTRAKKRRNIDAYIAARHRENGGSAVAISYKALRETMDLERLPNFETGHFNAIAGKDGWKDARSMFVVGRTLPRTSDAERFAEAATGDIIEPLPEGKYPKRETVRLVRRNDKIFTFITWAVYHPHPIAEAFRRLVCDNGLVQAVERVRRVSRTEPADIYLLTDTPIDIPIDGVIDADLINYPSPRDLMLAQGGVFFESAATATLAYPMLWATDKHLRNDLAAQRKREKEQVVSQSSGYLTQIDSLLGCLATAPNFTPTPEWGLKRLRFKRLAGGNRVETAYVDTARVADAKKAIESLIGLVDWLDETGGPEGLPLRKAVGAEDMTGQVQTWEAITPSTYRPSARPDLSVVDGTVIAITEADSTPDDGE